MARRLPERVSARRPPLEWTAARATPEPHRPLPDSSPEPHRRPAASELVDPAILPGVSEPITPAGPPAEISHLVRERMEARARHDWAAADALKARIEGAGWRVTDRGSRSSVSPAAPSTVEVAGEVRYGSAAAVPSLLDQPATATWTVVVVASEEPEKVSRLLSALRAQAPVGTRVVLVANDPSDSQAAALAPASQDLAPIDGTAPELLRTSTRLGFAAALNIALRRASGEFVLLADGSAWPTGDAMSPLATALADEAVAAGGGYGLVTPEPGPLRPNTLERDNGSAPRRDPAALEAGWLAFRRSDYRELGPLDEHFVTPAWLDVWWTLRLRVGEEPEAMTEARFAADEAAEAESPDEVAGTGGDGDRGESPLPATDPSRPDEAAELTPARRAVAVPLPLERDEIPWPPDRSRLNRRNMYRVLDRFGWRDDLG
jgi:hypothetical protein